MLNKLFTLLSLLIIVSSCSSNKKIKESELENPKPEWVISKPYNSTYFYGIGSVNTGVHSSNYQQIAKNKALEDLASEIEVTIDAQSVLRQKESNTAFIENYEATTRVDVQNNLTEYEVAETWNNNNEYWVLYRLSKSRYKTLEAEKRNSAMSKAMHFLDLSENETNYRLQVDNLLQAANAIKPYLNDPLKTERNNQQVYLGNYVLARINDHFNQLKIFSAENELTLDFSNCFSEDLSLSLQYNGLPVDNIPVRIKYNSYSDQKLTTDNFGIVSYKTQANFYETASPSIEAWVNTSDIIKDQMIATLFESKYSPISIKVRLQKPIVFIETENGKGTFQEIIEKSGAKLSPDSIDVDVILVAQFNTITVGKTDDFHTSSCTIKMKVYDDERKLLEEKTWPAAKGVHTNQISADSKAVENAIKQIKYTWIQKLIMEHCQR